jgi:hypothetical protein
MLSYKPKLLFCILNLFLIEMVAKTRREVKYIINDSLAKGSPLEQRSRIQKSLRPYEYTSTLNYDLRQKVKRYYNMKK